MNSGKKQQHTRAYSGGFTLVETLVALTLSTIIALAMSQTFVTGVKHVRTIDADAQLSSAVSYMSQTLAHQIHKAAEVTVASGVATIHAQDGSTLDLFLDGSTLKLGTDNLTPSAINVTAFAPEEVGESLHFTFTFQADTGITRDFSGQVTFTPWK